MGKIIKFRIDDQNYLEHHLQNVPLHLVDIHTKCDNLYCENDKMLNIINSHHKSLEPLQNYLKGISNRAKRVRIGVTSNIVESFFAVNGKMQHGKVKNLIQRGTFEYRCYAASLLFNNGQTWAFDLASELFNSDGLYFRRQQHAKLMKYTADRKRKNCTEYKRKRKITSLRKISLPRTVLLTVLIMLILLLKLISKSLICALCILKNKYYSL